MKKGMNEKRIIIIGANSYIARNVIYCLNRDYNHYNLELYDRADKHKDGHANYCKIDLTNESGIDGINLENADVVYVFTGKTGSLNSFEEYKTFLDVNELVLLNILKGYRKQSSKAKIVFPSTRLVYKGKIGRLKEDDEKEFKTIYAMNKYSCEQYLMQQSSLYNIRYCIFRICVPYGTMVKGAISYGTAGFMLRNAMEGRPITLYGEGASRRSLTHIEDLCDSLIKGALSDQCINNIYNIGGEDYSLSEMANIIAAHYGVGVDYIPWPKEELVIETGDTVFDDEKLRRAVSLQKQRRFEEWVKNADSQYE